jgi:hypothetical protein
MNPILPFTMAMLMWTGVSMADPPNDGRDAKSAHRPQSHHSAWGRRVVLLAGVPPRAEKWALAALHSAGIEAGGFGSLGVGISVRRMNFARARRVLAADAKVRGYKVTFNKLDRAK